MESLLKRKMKVTLKTATVKAAIATRAGIRKTYLEKLKDKWDKQKPLKVFPPRDK